MSETLPKAIADLCGILMGDTRRTAIPSSPVVDAVQVIEDSAGLWTINYSGTYVGTINKVKMVNLDSDKYLATSTHGQNKLCHSFNYATAWLLEEFA